MAHRRPGRELERHDSFITEERKSLKVASFGNYLMLEM